MSLIDVKVLIETPWLILTSIEEDIVDKEYLGIGNEEMDKRNKRG